MSHERLAQQLNLTNLSPVSGGDINEAYRAAQADGRSVFLKTHAAPPADFFAAEAAGLKALAEAGARVPEVIAQAEDHLLLEWIETAAPGPAAMAELGEQLASVHGHRGPCFGFTTDNFCGLTPQRNTQMTNGHEFFAVCRLLPQGERAFDQGRLSRPEMRQLERLCQRLPDLLPEQPPSVIHGDLWSGNALFDTRGCGALIDPAVSWSWAEADLALTHLFGGFTDSFYRGYENVRALDPGFSARVPVYNLYHLLNHLNLFGESYRASVQGVLQSH